MTKVLFSTKVQPLPDDGTFSDAILGVLNAQPERFYGDDRSVSLELRKWDDGRESLIVEILDKSEDNLGKKPWTQAEENAWVIFWLTLTAILVVASLYWF
jgi:hypothetical protein